MLPLIFILRCCVNGLRRKWIECYKTGQQMENAKTNLASKASIQKFPLSFYPNVGSIKVFGSCKALKSRLNIPNRIICKYTDQLQSPTCNCVSRPAILASFLAFVSLNFDFRFSKAPSTSWLCCIRARFDTSRSPNISSSCFSFPPPKKKKRKHT